MKSKFTYENQGTNTYLVYTVPDDEVIDSMTLGMLTSNKIPGLATTLFTQMDATKYIKYNVSAHIPVSQFFTGAVNKKRLLGVFKGIVTAILAAEDYMIDPNSILLNLDYIFADVASCETILVCMPVEREGVNQDLGAFFKGIMFTTQFDQTENCDYVAKIINYLNSSPLFSLNDFSALLDEIERGGAAFAPVVQPVAPQPVQAPPAAQPAQPQYVPPVQPVAPKPVQPQPAPQRPAQPQPRPAPQNPAPGKPVAPPMPPRQTAAPAANTGAGEKPMSFFYLMQHYNKENAAIYKAQQEAAKSKGAAPAPAAPQQPAAPAKPGAPGPGFAVPGAPSAPGPGFAVPGKSGAPAGFQVPGQPQPFAAPGKPAAPQPVAPRPAAPQPVAPRPAAPQPVAPQPVAPPVAPQPVYQPQGMPLNFGETTVLGGGGAGGETTVLSAAAEPNRCDPHLIRIKTNERIPLNRPIFKIGKERSYADYFIGDNPAISRSHANIVERGGEYFVMDTNSTNHTYVNGMMIGPGAETKLTHGDKLRLANEEFEFKMR